MALRRRSNPRRTAASGACNLGRTTKLVVPGLADGIFDYDSAGRPWHATHAERIAELSYTAASGAVDNGYLSAIDDPSGKLSSFERDAFGRVKSFTDPQLLRTKFSYDDAGNLTFLQSPKSVAASTNVLHSLTPNKMNALATYTPPVLPPLLPTPSDVQTSMFFDVDEALFQVDRPGGISLTFEREIISGKLSKVHGPSGDTNVEYYPQAPCPVGCSPGAVRVLTSPNGQSLTFAYDGPLVKSVAFAGVIDATVAQGYDTNFRTSAQAVTAGPRSSKLTYGYDVDNLLTCVSLGTCSAQDNGALRITRGALNPLLSATSLEKMVDSYAFSEFGELRGYSASFKDSATVTTPLVSISYDDPLTTRRDSLGRVMKQVETIEGVQHTTAFSYYCVFRCIRSAVPEASDQDSGHPIRNRSEATRTGAGQTVGWVSGWGFRPFWRRMDEPRRVSTCALCTSRSQMASAIV
jgi:YD repeat-containing protein